MDIKSPCDYCHETAPTAVNVHPRQLPDGEWADLCADCWRDVVTANRKGN